jgi:hypothetical protein
MTGFTQQLRERSGRWRRVWAALLGHEQPAVSELDESISFPELVWAHFERQREVHGGVTGGPWETEFRRRLKRFKDEQGNIVEAYWCRHEASGVALTENRLPRKALKLFRREWILRLHTATDWRTENAPLVASALHQWETAGIKAGEILRDTSERIALNWIFSASSRVLAFIDRDTNAAAATEVEVAKVIADQQTELEEVQDYYVRAGENSARIVYFRGMLWGTAALAAIVGGGFLAAWAIGWLDAHDESTFTLFVSVAMGAAGAILSVMTRMAKRNNSFNLEFEVGRKSVRFLGALRPWIGAMFALAVYVALKSTLVEFVQSSSTHGIYYYATIGFVAGFSERRAKVLLDGVGGGAPADNSVDEKNK